MPGAFILFKGKNKTEIAYEAFMILGIDATQAEINRYFREEYGVAEGCKMHLYYETRSFIRTGNPYIEGERPRYEKAKQTWLETQRQQAQKTQKSSKTTTSHIRDIFSEHGPDLPESQVIDILAKKGVKVHRKIVHVIIMRLKKKEEKTVATEQPAVPPSSEKKESLSVHGLTLDDIKIVKQVCEDIGLANVKKVLAGIGQLTLPNFRRAVELVDALQLTPPVLRVDQQQ